MIDNLHTFDKVVNMRDNRKLEKNIRNHPVWIELSRNNLKHNWQSIQKVIGPKITVIAMVKSNAYGHGTVLIGRELEKLGAKYLGVSALPEAQELRYGEIKTPILIADWVEPDNIQRALALKNITLTVSDTAHFDQIESAAKKLRQKIKIHINIDTGMHREGVWPPKKAVEFATRAFKSPYVDLEGLFTHFATAGDSDTSCVKQQLAAFNRCLDEIETKNIPLPKYIHAAEGASVMRFPEMYKGDPYKRFTAVRPGNIIYGLPPGSGFPYLFPLRKVMVALKAKLAGVKIIEKGETVGYDCTWKAKTTTRIGTVISGYTDGYRRSLSNKGYMLVHGMKAAVLGRISMNQTMIKLSLKDNYKVGDEVVIVGKQGSEEITIEELAISMGTFWFEYIVTLHANRLPRFFVD